MRRAFLILASPMFLAACSGGPLEGSVDPAEDSTLSEPMKSIAPTNFAALTLGGTIQGPLGPEVEA